MQCCGSLLFEIIRRGASLTLKARALKCLTFSCSYSAFSLVRSNYFTVLTFVVLKNQESLYKLLALRKCIYPFLTELVGFLPD